MLRALKTITFLYVPQEDRIAGAINAGHPDAWSCWLTRRGWPLPCSSVRRITSYVESGATRASGAARRSDRIRARGRYRQDCAGDVADAAGDFKSSTAGAELADRLTIARVQDAFRLELRGHSGNGAAGAVKREELQRILQMLHSVVAQAGWLAA